ncbi:hypothetical protein SAMN05660776_1703 [Salegentibacter holothuriorum]|uniref:Uncharacterized protein n=1 Tax=Salegentibacter holothuriorum TaxID=241145 RepID=A0A1T5C1Q1_9FLAO|nr:hypothetical protein SAMN05660776_1703 [Salegentibacter holothuriorum]
MKKIYYIIGNHSKNASAKFYIYQSNNNKKIKFNTIILEDIIF